MARRLMTLPQAVIDLGHNPGLEVIAEGVESAGQRALLHAWGYQYGRPMDGAGGASAPARYMPDHTQV